MPAGEACSAMAATLLPPRLQGEARLDCRCHLCRATTAISPLRHSASDALTAEFDALSGPTLAPQRLKQAVNSFAARSRRL